MPNEPKKIKATNQNPQVTKTLQILSRPHQNPPCPTIEDVIDNQPSNEKPSTSVPLKGKMEQPPEIILECPIENNLNNEKEEKTIQNFGSKISNVQTDKSPLPFNLRAEVAKLKILVPLTELVKHETYRSQISKSLNFRENEDSVNLFDVQPELIFGPDVNGNPVEGGIPPFYISLNIHDKILQNAMLDSGASHNLMPKSVMEKLNLDITGPYKDLFSFDSSQVKCLGPIKYLCVSLVQYPAKTILMDVVVDDIPPKYGLLLSRSWGAKLQGSLQLDMSYATISVFGHPKKLYSKTLMKYVVSTQERPQNFHIYSVHSDIDSFIFYNAETNQEDTSNNITAKPKEIAILKENQNVQIHEISDKKDDLDTLIKKDSTTLDENYEHEILWHLEFDGSVKKLGAGAGVWIYNLENDHAEGHAYRLNFKCTNNMVEYEALLLGLKLVKRLGAIRLSIMGDSELVIKQIKVVYMNKDPRLGFYKGMVIEILNSFLETKIVVIPRKHNMQAHSLAMFPSTCKLPF